MEYPLSLALVDFLPVLAMATGVTLLVARVGALAGPKVTRVALAGGTLVVIGGALKATWKTIVALGGPDIVWMAKAQFFLLGPGFTLLAWALLSVRPGEAGRRIAPLWAFVAFALIGVVAAAGVGATWPLLVVTTASATLLAVRMILLAQKSGDTVAMALLGFNILGTYSMGMLAGQPEQTITLQWFEESLNTCVWTAFAVAVWRLTRAGRALTHVRAVSAS
ncbi:hypothetical protein [Streptosporangium sp. NPDC002607]